jgi:uncharacterized protein
MATTQILIVRLLSLDLKPRVKATTFRTIRGILYLAWAAIVMAYLFRVPQIGLALHWLPTPIRSGITGIGNLWGMASVPSLGIYYIYRYLARKLFPRQGAVVHSPERRRLIHAAGTAAVVAPFAIAGFGAFIERTDFEVKEVDLPVPGLHPDLEGLRIGQLSDLHVSPWLSVNDLGRAIDMLNELKPHLTLVTGDLITQAGDPLDDTIRELSRLRADAGILGCLGNHEMFTQCESYTAEQAARYGMDFLRHRARVFRWGKGELNVAGVDFQRPGRKRYLTGAQELLVPGVTNVLLSHNPAVFPIAVEQGWDATIGGHTHGGQVTLGVFNQTLNLARFLTPYVSGLYQLEGKSCYVTNGIGTIGIPVRIGTPPEVTLLRLRRA